MSGGQACTCDERREPVLSGAAFTSRPARLWRVVQRYCNHSAFNGYHRTPSRYSAVTCLRCGRHWRTTAGYVAMLPNIAPGEENISVGYERHREAMEARGRTPLGVES